MPKNKTKVEISKSPKELSNKILNETHQELRQQKLQNQLLKAIQKEDTLKVVDQIAKLIKAGAIIDEKILAHSAASSIFEQLSSKAVKENDLKLIKLLIKGKVTFTDTSMVIAGNQSNLDIIKELLKVENYSGSQTLQQNIASGAIQNNHPQVIRYLQSKYPNENFISIDNIPFINPEFLRFIVNQNHIPDINEALQNGIFSTVILLGINSEANIEQPLRLLSILCALDAQINTNNSVEINFYRLFAHFMLNSLTKSEAIAAGLNILNTFEGLIATDELNSFKQSLRELLKEKLRNFDPKLESQNLKEHFKDKCIGDLVDYIQQLNSTSSIIRKYGKLYQQDPEFSQLMSKFESSKKKLVNDLQIHKTDLLLDHIIVDKRLDNSSELQKTFKGRMIRENQNKEASVLFNQDTLLLRELLNYYSSKDLGDLGVSYLKISDLQQEVKKEKQKLYTQLNEQRSDKALKELKSWAQKVMTNKSPSTRQR